jgi:hypothetical protein
MQMLHDRNIGPFAAMVPAEDSSLPPRLSPVTLRYHLPEAAAVNLIWWLQSGRLVPLPIRPAGTTAGPRGTALSTPMHRADSAFTITLRVPRGDSLEYGFLITVRNNGDTLSGVWDGVRHYDPDAVSASAIRNEQPTVKLLTDPPGAGDTIPVRLRIRYGPTDARQVRVVWGIDDWQRLPDRLLPPHTRTTDSHLSLTAMQPNGSMFESTLPVPAGRRLDFAFQLDRADQYDVSDRQRYTLSADRDSTVTIRPSLTRVTGSSLSSVLRTGALALFGCAVLAGLSALAGRLLRQRAFS